LDQKIKPAAMASTGESAMEKAYATFAQYEQMQGVIKDLLIKANQAKNNGQWGKAQAILWELRRITRNNYAIKI
jgi:hypothetical protein